jgi:hypothetical protein
MFSYTTVKKVKFSLSVINETTHIEEVYGNGGIIPSMLIS